MKKMSSQNGAALAIGLILLLIITLTGYTGMKGTILQEKMAAGLHNKTLANGGANSALRAGEKLLYNLVKETNGVNIEGTPNGSLRGIYSNFQDVNRPESGLNQAIEDFIEDGVGGTDHDGFDFTSISNKNARLSSQPKFIIHEITTTPTGVTVEFGNVGGGSDGNIQKTYAVTGRSSSGDGLSDSVFQSIYTSVTSSNPSQ